MNPEVRGRRLIFVGGSPRSGTTLVQNILDTHPEVFGGPEFDRTRDIIELRRKLHHSIERGRIDTYCSKEKVDAALAGMIEGFLLPAADRAGKRYLSEKTPWNVLVFSELLDLFGAARFLHVIRDPRAIFASMATVAEKAHRKGVTPPPYTEDLDQAIERIRECAAAGEAARRMAPGRVLTIQYETLVTHPEAETRRLCDFLSLPWHPELLHPGQKKHAGEKTLDGVWYDRKDFYRDPDTSRIDRWREKLASEQVARLNAAFAADPLFRGFGYDFTADARSAGDRITVPAEEQDSHAQHGAEGAADRPKISVVLITCNSGKYVRESIESLLAQTLPFHEILICDDHSEDDTWEIISEYAGKYPGLIRAFHHERNLGIAKNLNFGFQRATGDLITLVAGDDRFHPRKSELEWVALRDHPEARVVYSNVRVIDEHSRPVSLWYEGKGPRPPSGDVFLPVCTKRFFPGNRGVFRNWMVYRSAFEEAGPFDESFDLFNDWDMAVRLAARFPIVYSGEVLVDYRRHGEGVHNWPARRRATDMAAAIHKNMPLITARRPDEVEEIARHLQDFLETVLAEEKTEAKPGPQAAPSRRDRRRKAAPTPSGGAGQVHGKNAASSPAPSPGPVPPFLVNSVPKAGTHLLKKIVEMLPGIAPTGLEVLNYLADEYDGGSGSAEKTCLVGVDWPRPVPLSGLRQTLMDIPPGHFAIAHSRYSEEFGALVEELGMRTLLILRDPRDVVVSHASFVARKREHFLYDIYAHLGEEERIERSITGIAPDSGGGPMLLNIAERFRSVLPWMPRKYNYTTYFEMLVGEKGGGIREVQIEEIRNLLKHLGIPAPEEKIEAIAEGVFGGTYTYRKGRIGAWRSRFTEKHIRLFKEIAGQLLIDLGYERDLDWRADETAPCPAEAAPADSFARRGAAS